MEKLSIFDRQAESLRRIEVVAVGDVPSPRR